MKKNLVFILIAGFFVFNMQAQETTFAAKLGANFSNYYGDDVVSSKVKTGIYGGFSADISVSDNFSIEPSVLFSFEGNKGTDINYLRIPLLAKYYVMDGLSLNFGPNVGFAVLAEDEDGNNIKKGVNTVDVALHFGTSYVLENNIIFTAGYNHGVTEVFKGNNDAKTTMWQVGIGYRFE